MKLEWVRSEALGEERRGAVLALCRAAYGEDLEEYLRDAGPGVHLLGMEGDTLLSHAFLVTRGLQPEGIPILRTAYIELVATLPAAQGRGYATHLLRALEDPIRRYELGALSPSDPAFYARLGWELWRGPLAMRTAEGIVPAPEDEEVMILRTPLTPGTLDLDARLSIEWRPGEVW